MEKIFLTDEEKQSLAGNENGVRDLLLNKAILAEAEKYEFTDEEKEDIDYIFENEQSRYFLAKKIEDKINVKEEEVTRVYTENKKYFDQQKLSFSDARDIIRRDLVNAQVAELENSELASIIEKLGKNIEITKEEILFSKGNPEVIKSLIMNKVVELEIEKDNFKETHQKELEIIGHNAKMNYCIDSQVRKNISVTQKEVEEVYNKEKAKLGDITPNEAYNQIANGLLNNKAVEERNRIITKIAEDYKIEDLVKENLALKN